MPYRVDVNGCVVCDTAEEALAFQRLAHDLRPEVIEPEHCERTPEQARESFTLAVKDRRRSMQRKLLALIHGRGELGITTTELADATGTRDTQVIVRALQNINIVADNVGFPMGEVFVRRPNGRYVAGAWLKANQPPVP